MSTDANQYLPNDQTFELQLAPKSTILDRRGEWTSILSAKLELAEWKVAENQIDVFNKGDTEHVRVTFKEVGCTLVDATRDQFLQKAETVLQTVFSLPDFPEAHVRRMEQSSRFGTPFKGSFKDLLKKVRERYADLKPEAFTALAVDEQTTSFLDNGAPYYFEDEHGTLHTYCGAMERKQLKKFFRYKDEDDLPPVALYFGHQYFVEPDAVWGVEEAVSQTKLFALEAWARHQRVRKLIVGG